MNENQNEPETEKPQYIDYTRLANANDLKDLNMRSGKTSRILNSKGYYKVGHIYAIRNF